MFSTLSKTYLGKGENAGFQHFLLFPNVFYVPIKNIFHHYSHIKNVVANPFNLDRSKFFSFANEVNVTLTVISRFDWLENIVEKEENTINQHDIDNS